MSAPRGRRKIERACQEGVERVASLTESAGGLLGVEGERVSLSSGRQVNGVNSDLSSAPVSLSFRWLPVPPVSPIVATKRRYIVL